MEKNNMILLGVLALMIVISAAQALQFNALSNSLNDLKVSGAVSTVPLASSGPSSSASVSSVLSNLPTQVGGC